MKVHEMLKNIYEQHNPEWVEKNGLVIRSACMQGLAFGGSIAMAFGHKRPNKNPGDIDLIAESMGQAMGFVSYIVSHCEKYRFRARVYIQNKTDWVPPKASAHIRLSTSMFMDVCVFVRPDIKFWYPCAQTKVQDYNEVVESAENITERDGKQRVAQDSCCEQIDLSAEQEEEWVEERRVSPSSGMINTGAYK